MQTEIFQVWREHGGAETGLGPKEPMVKPVSSVLRHLSLPFPNNPRTSRAEVEAVIPPHCVWETVTCLFDCQGEVDFGRGGWIYLFLGKLLSIPCQDLPQIFLPVLAAPPLQPFQTAAHPQGRS